MNRDAQAAVDTQCVVFQHVTQDSDVPWNTQLYLMMLSVNFVNDYSTSALQVLPSKESSQPLSRVSQNFAHPTL